MRLHTLLSEASKGGAKEGVGPVQTHFECVLCIHELQKDHEKLARLVH